MNIPKIILVAEPSDASLPALRKQVRSAMQLLGWMPAWQECLPGDGTLPMRYRKMQGPLVLASGRMVNITKMDEMVHSLEQIGAQSARWAWLRKPLAAGSVVPGILLAFFPKCAGCWAAYFSVFNSMGIGVPYMPWMKHVLAATLVLSTIYFARMARRRQRWLPFGFQVLGFAAVLLAQYALRAPGLMWVGVGLVFTGSLLYAMPDAWMRSLQRRLGMQGKVAVE